MEGTYKGHNMVDINATQNMKDFQFDKFSISNYIIFYVMIHLTGILLSCFIDIVFELRFIKTLWSELISMIGLSMLHYEIIAAMEDFDPKLYAYVTFITMYCWRSLWKYIDSYPNIILEYMLLNKIIRSKGIYVILVQILGDYFAFKFLSTIWNNLGIKRSMSCPATFHKDIMMDAFVFEWLLTIVYRLTIYILIYISRYQRCVSIMTTLLSTICKTIGLLFIGSVNNPALGVSLRYSCTGIDDYQNLLVYWFAPFCGSITALFVLVLCKRCMNYLLPWPTYNLNRITLGDIAINTAIYTQRKQPSQLTLRIPFKPRAY